MAIPKINKPNYTEIPNDILDNINRFTPEELKVIVIIARYTMDKQRLTLPFIARATGLSKYDTMLAVDSLLFREKIKTSRVGRESIYTLNMEP